MSEGSLSQEEIDALMAGAAAGADPDASDTPEAADAPDADWLTPSEIDTIGEVGNICMSSAATALSTLLGHQVQITTPTVAKVDEDELRTHFDTPAVVVVIEYTEGLAGRNVFVLTQRDASVVADLMMGGAGVASDELSELHTSAIGEAMNQMMGSASTAMAEMAGHRVDISAPSVAIIDLASEAGGLDLGLEGDIVRCSFQLRVEDLLDTTLMQLMPVPFARSLVDGLLQPAAAPAAATAPDAAPAGEPGDDDRHLHAVPVPVAQPVTFPSLDEMPSSPGGSDISLLLDVPLQVTVELGRAQMRIRNVLELVPGSIVELDKLAGEPVDVLVNGKQIARGEVVVIDEEFGVRITDVASQAKRLRGLAAGDE
ncbi:flagellar motor switch phosphatase FliY [Miltoncostaea oceani]|uniref:flagellar motor switch phosphatase FliY n=1 Tax=Miltoncostaea oceani TaxID=2843216 RepID=UPI001C3E7639|nr:flagellar motor switch phosphatase FliY [Miltoncostaea oceani]